VSRRTLHLIVGITAGMIVGTVHALVTHAGQQSSVAARAERPAEPRPDLAVVELGEGVFIVVPAGAVSGRDAASLSRAGEPGGPP
jgi:hypothetical protein